MKKMKIYYLFLAFIMLSCNASTNNENQTFLDETEDCGCTESDSLEVENTEELSK